MFNENQTYLLINYLLIRNYIRLLQYQWGQFVYQYLTLITENKSIS